LLRVLEPTPLSRADDGTLSLGEKLSPADTCTNLYSVLDAFRHPDCGFIAPLLPQEFAANAVVDIGHEALIRRWDRLIHQGWLEEEARDGQRYRALIELLPGPLPANLTPQWLRWWDERPRTAGWAERYGGGFVDIANLLAKSEQRLHRGGD